MIQGQRFCLDVISKTQLIKERRFLEWSIRFHTINLHHSPLPITHLLACPSPFSLLSPHCYFSSWNMSVLLASGPWHLLPKMFLHPQPGIYIAPSFSFSSSWFDSKANFSLRPFLATLSANLTFCLSQSQNFIPSFPAFSSLYLSPCGMICIYLSTVLSLSYWNVNPMQANMSIEIIHCILRPKCLAHRRG